jgi:hypothetical protein
VQLTYGWNLIGLPRLPKAMKASDLLADIAAQGGNCSEAARWRFGAWQAHPRGVPVNVFDLTNYEGYFVKCAGNALYIPGVGLTSATAAEPRPKPAAPDMAAADDPAIFDVRVTNLRDVAFTVTWRTDRPSTGRVAFGLPGSLDRSAGDDRGDETVAAIHHVTVAGLAPQTAYAFRVHSGESTDDDGGQPFTVQTTATGSLAAPFTAYGQVQYAGGAPAVGALVLARLVNDQGAPVTLLSALVESQGYWSLNLPLANCEGAMLEMAVTAPDGATAAATVPACTVQPAPSLTLEASASYRLYLPALSR